MIGKQLKLFHYLFAVLHGRGGLRGHFYTPFGEHSTARRNLMKANFLSAQLLTQNGEKCLTIELWIAVMLLYERWQVLTLCIPSGPAFKFNPNPNRWPQTSSIFASLEDMNTIDLFSTAVVNDLWMWCRGECTYVHTLRRTVHTYIRNVS